MTKREAEEVVWVLEPEAEESAQLLSSGETDLVELLLQAQAEREARERAAAQAERPARIEGVVIGRIVEAGERGPVVTYPGCPSPTGLVARAAAVVTEADIGRPAALLFEGGDASRPMLIGLVHGEIAQPASSGGLTVRETEDRIEVVCSKTISLQCGEARVVITPSGKIVLRGKYLLSRAAGLNRIRGGSVQIN